MLSAFVGRMSRSEGPLSRTGLSLGLAVTTDLFLRDLQGLLDSVLSRVGPYQADG